MYLCWERAAGRRCVPFFSDFGIVAPEINEFFCDAIGKLKSLKNFPDFIEPFPRESRSISEPFSEPIARNSI